VLGRLGRIRHMQFLASIALLLLAQPFATGRFADRTLDLLLLVTLVSAILAFSHQRSRLITGLVLVALLQAGTWYRSWTGMHELSVPHSLLCLACFGYFTALVMNDVFRARSVSTDTICGALAAYLLLGIWWSFAYALLEGLVPGSILGLRQQGGAPGYDQFIGYSFVTLATLGYGNVVPGNAKADTLAYSEAIVGQVYLTVLVARLVALNITAPREPDE